MIWRFATMADPLVVEWHSRDLDSLPNPREVAAVNDWLRDSNQTFQIMRDHPLHNSKILGGAFGMRISGSNHSYNRQQAIGMGSNRKKSFHSVFQSHLDQDRMFPIQAWKSKKHLRACSGWCWMNPSGSISATVKDLTNVCSRPLSGNMQRTTQWLMTATDVSSTTKGMLRFYLFTSFLVSKHGQPIYRIGNRDHSHRAFPTQRINGPNYSEPKEPNFVGSNGGKISFPTTRTCPVKCRPIEHLDWQLC